MMAKRTRNAAAKSSPARSELADATSSSGARFGVILEIGGKTVPLSGGNIADAMANGVDFDIRDPVELGALDDITIAGFNLKTDAIDKLPSLLKPVADVITGAVWTVAHAHLNVPSEADTAKGIKYSIEVDGEFATPISLEVLSIKGVVFGPSNEDQSSKP
jgi:hypothetical protein